MANPNDIFDRLLPGEKPSYDELVEIVRSLAGKQEVTLADLPMASLKNNLEQTWQPDASSLLLPASIGPELLAVNPSGFLFNETAAVETTASTSYTDLATVGPTLTITTSGIWLIGWGARIYNNTAATGTQMALSVNGAAPTQAVDNYASAIAGGASNAANNARFATFTLSAGNTVRGRYAVTGGSGTFQNRWLLGARIG